MVLKCQIDHCCQAGDDQLFEQTESLRIGLANPSSSTGNSVAVSIH